MAFRQYGGLNYNAKNNIITNTCTTTTNLTLANEDGTANVINGNLYVNGNITAGKSIILSGAGLTPRYSSGWFFIENVDIIGYTSGISFPALNFSLNINNIPIFKLLTYQNGADPNIVYDSSSGNSPGVFISYVSYNVELNNITVAITAPAPGSYVNVFLY